MNTMETSMTVRLLAVTERIDGPKAWVHLCVTAAEEAAAAQGEASGVPTTSAIEEAVGALGSSDEVKGINAHFPVGVLFRLGKAHICGATSHGNGSAAAIAYCASLPPITTRRSIQSFVACVAAGVLRGFITAKDANTLLYAAQAALSAHPKRTARKGRKA